MWLTVGPDLLNATKAREALKRAGSFTVRNPWLDCTERSLDVSMSGPRRLNTVSTLEAARMLLAQVGITGQILGMRAKPTEMPTLDDYVERVTQEVSDGARRAYASYWNRARKVWGTRRLDELTPLGIKQFAEHCKADVVVRSNSRGGRSAAEHASPLCAVPIGLRVADGLITEADNPAALCPSHADWPAPAGR